MDPGMSQLIAERFGLNKDECDALERGDLSSFMSGRLFDRFSDPATALLVHSLFAQNSSPKEVKEEPSEKERVLARAKKIIRHLKERLEATQTMLSYLADILGACPACWGQNKLCPSCKGKGKPGSAVPKEEELLVWIEPALKKLGMRIERLPEEKD